MGVGSLFQKAPKKKRERKEKIMELSVSSYSYSGARSADFTMDNVIDHVKATGFDGIEILYGERIKDYDIIDSMKYFKDKCAEKELKTFNCPGGVNLLADDQKEQIENGKKLIDAAAALGAPMVRCDTMPGGCGVMGLMGGGGIKEAIKKAVPAIKEIAYYAHENNIELLVENHGHIMQDSIIVEELINSVNLPYYGALVDVGNFVCADEDPVIGVGRLARYAKHVHVKDFHIKSGSEVFLPTTGWFTSRGASYLRGAMIGHGDVPVFQCLRILKQYGYNGALSVEFEGIEKTLPAIEEAYRVLRKALTLLG